MCICIHDVCDFVFYEKQEKDILQGKGSVSNAEMESIVRKVYDEFDTNRKHYDAQLADIEDLETLENLEKSIKDKKQ